MTKTGSINWCVYDVNGCGQRLHYFKILFGWSFISLFSRIAELVINEAGKLMERCLA